MFGHGQDGLHVEIRVTHDSPVPDAVLADLELRLDHEQEVGVVGRCSQQRFEDQGQGDERQVTHHQAGGRYDCGRVQRADVGAVQGSDTGVGSQGPGQLAVADVNGYDVLGAVAKEDVGEAARGGARVQAAAALDARRQAALPQHVQRAGELVSAAGDVVVSARGVDLDGLGRVDLTGGLSDHRAVESDVATGDERGGVSAGAGQPTAHELGVDADESSHISLPPCAGRRRAPHGWRSRQSPSPPRGSARSR